MGIHKVIVTTLESHLATLQSQELDDPTLVELIDVQLGLNLEADSEEVYWE